ncbi:MAG: HEPN domain-containing protein [Chloroflexota bacterium]
MTPGAFDKKALIQYRLERAFETLESAKLVQEQGNDPASVVNRAYYAMFYAALALLETIGKEPSKHSGVLALFDQHFIKPGILPKEMGKFLHTAFDMRLSGDYEDKVKITEEAAVRVLDSAIQFVNSIRQKLTENS